MAFCNLDGRLPDHVPTCPRCGTEEHPDHGCAECHVMDEGGETLLDEISEHSHREHGRGFGKLTSYQQWQLIEDHD